ncbi:hypothetical protein GFB79_20785 [Acinetobacter baumannii]|nr:hypothetical protein [Acinetobacter baumannii]MEE1856630.1 hypothetical protein [Acinetobacter baumannii]HAV4485843.1 hypothetical protein [Acinetobacter baumannii]HAV4486095.1 hypothetical protein [Acinetobacter baumannii]HAV4538930.1 hypothetical protein [Acinetobacter baumannii]
MSYHHLNFEDRTALMLESRKEGFQLLIFQDLLLYILFYKLTDDFS